MKARLPEGYQNKGANNMNSMIKQAQKLHDESEALQEELNQRDYTETAGGGLIEVVMSGAKKLKSVKISPDIIDKDNPQNLEDLEDLIIAGINAVIAKIDEENKREMEKITGGFNIPGLGF